MSLLDDFRVDIGDDEGVIPSGAPAQVLLRAIHFSPPEIGRGVTAPTDVLIGTSPEVPALLFNNVNETAIIYTSFSPDMDLSQDMKVRIQFSLVNVQASGDALSLTIDYIIPVEGITGSGLIKTSTQLTPTRILTPDEGLAINDLYSFKVTLPTDDAANPVLGGASLALEIHLTNVVDVAAIHVLDCDLEYIALY